MTSLAEVTSRIIKKITTNKVLSASMKELRIEAAAYKL